MNNIRISFYSHSIVIRVMVIFLLMAMGGTATAKAYNTGSISISFDNDGLLGSDRGYTNGLFFKFNSSSVTEVENLSPFAIKKIASLLPLTPKTNKGWGVTIGQQIWTPKKINSTLEQKNDRPYVGLLFVKASIFESSESMANKYSLLLGTIGPNAYAEKSQKTIHSIIGSREPLGWNRQIEDETVFNFSYETQRLLTRAESWYDQYYDLGLTGRINLGNFQNEVAVGGVIRWGNALQDSFASVGFTPGNYIDPSALSKSKSGVFTYLALEGRYRFNDVTLEGARPEHMFDVQTKHWQSTVSSGVICYQGSWGVTLSFIASTPDYNEDIYKYNATASIDIFWRG